MGCDVSKGYSDFIVLDESEDVIERVFQLDDTNEGHTALFDYFSRFFQTHEKAELCVGMESTGGYENNWYGMLLRMREIFELHVTRLNPLAVKRHHEAAMRRNVTDDISAYNVASFLIAYRNKITYEQDTTFSSIRKQWNFTQLLIKQKTQLINQLGFLVYQSNPGLVQYCKNSVSQWVLELLSRYPTATKLAGAKATTVAKIPYIPIGKAEIIIKEAKASVASCADESDGFLIKEVVRQIVSLTSAISVQKNNMEKNCTIPETDLLCSVLGIGIHSAIGLMINIVSISRFITAKKLASYFGLHPVYKQSGDGIWGFHMSKQGRSQPRAILYMVVLSAINCNPVIKELYERCLANKMDRLAAIGVCMHKMLRIIYGILLSNKKFDPSIDEKNRKHFLVRDPEKKHFEKKRRFQIPNQAAPISKRQTKTRAKQKGGQKESQKSSTLTYGIIQSLPKNKNMSGHVGNGNTTINPVRIEDILMSELAELHEIYHT